MAQIVDISGSAHFTGLHPLAQVQGMIIHHTGPGMATAQDVMSVFKQRDFPAQFVIDRAGVIYQTLPTGSTGRQIESNAKMGLSNADTIGVEIMGANDKDINPVQVEAAQQLYQYLATDPAAAPWKATGLSSDQVYGHGVVNPWAKQATEGQTAARAIAAAFPPGSIAAAASAADPYATTAFAGWNDPQAASDAAPPASDPNTLVPAAPDQSPAVSAWPTAVTASANPRGVTPEAQSVYSLLTQGDAAHGVPALSSAVAAGAVGNMMQESYTNLRPDAKGAAGEIGIGQWMPDRYANMTAWTTANGLDPNSREGQALFYSHELQGSPAWAALAGVKTPGDAAQIIASKFERAGSPMMDRRVGFANAVAAGPPDTQVAADPGAGAPADAAPTALAYDPNNLTADPTAQIAAALAPPNVQLAGDAASSAGMATGGERAGGNLYGLPSFPDAYDNKTSPITLASSAAPGAGIGGDASSQLSAWSTPAIPAQFDNKTPAVPTITAQTSYDLAQPSMADLQQPFNGGTSTPVSDAVATPVPDQVATATPVSDQVATADPTVAKAATELAMAPRQTGIADTPAVEQTSYTPSQEIKAAPQAVRPTDVAAAAAPSDYGVTAPPQVTDKTSAIPKGPYGLNQVIAASLSGDQTKIAQAWAAVRENAKNSVSFTEKIGYLAGTSDPKARISKEISGYFSTLPNDIKTQMAQSYAANPSLWAAVPEEGRAEGKAFAAKATEFPAAAVGWQEPAQELVPESAGLSAWGGNGSSGGSGSSASSLYSGDPLVSALQSSASTANLGPSYTTGGDTSGSSGDSFDDYSTYAAPKSDSGTSDYGSGSDNGAVSDYGYSTAAATAPAAQSPAKVASPAASSDNGAVSDYGYSTSGDLASVLATSQMPTDPSYEPVNYMGGATAGGATAGPVTGPTAKVTPVTYTTPAKSSVGKRAYVASPPPATYASVGGAGVAPMNAWNGAVNPKVAAAAKAAGYSTSSYVPEGYRSPNYSAGSGGSTMAYNPYGGAGATSADQQTTTDVSGNRVNVGSYITSNGTPMSYTW